jgi:hypothetical protein
MRNPDDTDLEPSPKVPLREYASLYLMVFLSLATAANLWITARLSWRIENINWEVHYRRQIARLQDETSKREPAVRPPAKEPSKVTVTSPEEEFKHLTLSDILLGLADTRRDTGRFTVNLTYEQARDIGKLMPDLRRSLAEGDSSLQSTTREKMKALLFRDQLIQIDRIKRDYGDRSRNDMECLQVLVKNTQAVYNVR